jgi:integrase/recombinase XerD
MLETHLTSPITRRRLRTGIAADHIDAFADWLHLQGYRPTSIDNSLTSLAAWSDWMLTAGFTTQDVVPGFEACKLAVGNEQRVRHSRGPNQQSITAASLFIRFLQLQGKLPLPIAKPSATERWPILGEFRSWMRSHRGLTETTLDVYQGILPGLLDALGDDAHAYSAEALRTFVLERARPHGIQRAKSIVVAVRSFLRFLGVTGRCLPGMEHAIPGFASWQLSSVPRFLAAEDVERVIDSCAGQPFELRDRAVLLLLARLALRASEVAQSEILRYRLAQRWNPRLRKRSPAGIASTTARDWRRDSAVCE